MEGMSTWPKCVRRMVAAVQEAGLEPQVTGQVGGTWEVFVEGKRIRAAAFYELRGGRTQYSRGELLVDGEVRPRVNVLNELRQLWDEYELPVSAAEPPALAVFQDPGPADEMPTVVAQVFRSMSRQASSDVLVRAGLTAAGAWIVGFDLPGSTDGMRMFFIRAAGGWTPDPDRMIQLIVDGKDASVVVDGSLERAMELLAAREQRPAGTPGASAVRQRERARDTGVETRRMVVKRE